MEEIMADQQGTGKHPHKSTEEPYPHHRGSNEGGSENRSDNRMESRSESESESRDLKEREYRDSQGNIHHHTHTSNEERNK
jgi:hypothetical protein